MRISRLYLKYFVVVMSLIVASQIIIAMMFSIIMATRAHKPHDDRFFETGYLLRGRLREIVETDRNPNPPIREISAGLELPYKVRIWITGPGGSIIERNTDAELFAFPEMRIVRKGVGIVFVPGDRPCWLIRIGCPTAAGEYTIFMQTTKPPMFRSDPAIFIGLGIVTVIVAVILFPLIRRITIPLKELTYSVHAISRGDFDIRVDENTGDELGELAKAFNMMSEKLLVMIRGTRELTANVSHQIRSPLARLSVASEILREKIEKNDTAGVRRILDTIAQEIGFLDRLTGRIIDLARRETTLIDESNETIDLAAEGKAAAERYADMIFKRRIGFVERIRSPAAVTASSASIQDLFDILFDNAIKYCTGERRIRLSIRTEGSRAVIEMYNTSAGFSSEALADIFRPFVRNESERIPGYGLGLAIAAHIVRDARGSILARNTENGIIFVIDFPLAPGDNG